jgi:alpha-tubulin suppressor-like RCC1 family protein
MSDKGHATAFALIFFLLSIFVLPVDSTGAQPVIAGGSDHSIALRNDGAVFAWGRNASGQLGDGTTINRNTPVAVKRPGGTGFITNATAVAGGSDHSIALRDDGTVLAWGSNVFGQLGDGTTTNRSTPVQVKGPGGIGFLTGVAAIAGGTAHTIALKDDGTVWTWGYNGFRQLGDGTTTDRSTPVQVKGPGGIGFLAGVAAIAGGYDHTIALKGDGTVWTWGGNDMGGLGDGTTTNRSTPVQVKGPGGIGFLTGVAAIAGGSLHTVALKDDGTVWAWGSNEYGQLGDGTATLTMSTPVQVKGPGEICFLMDVAAVAGGYDHTIALKEDGTVWAWGRNSYGELGDGTTTMRTAPVQVRDLWGMEFLTGAAAVASGWWHVIALKGDGTAWAWGWNSYGELGDGTTTDRHNPVQVKGTEGKGYINYGIYEGREYYIPYHLSDAGYWTGVGLRNVSTVVSASVTVSAINQSGSVVDSQARTIPPRGQTAFMMGPGEGWVKVTSSVPLTGLAFVAEKDGEKLMFDMTLIPESAAALHVPHVAQDGTWDTVVYVCNPHVTETDVYLTFVLSDGTVVTTVHHTLPANGSGEYPLSGIAGGGAYTSGSIEIAASQGVAAFALYHNLKTGDRSYAGISAVKP